MFYEHILLQLALFFLKSPSNYLQNKFTDCMYIYINVVHGLCINHIHSISRTQLNKNRLIYSTTTMEILNDRSRRVLRLLGKYLRRMSFTK